MQQVTLKPGDYVATKGMTEEQYHAIARAFMNAGALGGEYPNTRYAFESDLECFGVKLANCGLFHGDRETLAFSDGRELTIDQVLNATNAGNKETDMQNWTPADLFKHGDGEWGQREGDCYVTRTYKDGKLIKTTHHELNDLTKASEETDMRDWKPEVGKKASTVHRGECEVLAIDDERKDVAVRFPDGVLSVISYRGLNPPLTEEDEAIGEMKRIFDEGVLISIDDRLRNIYRAGYRKQPTDDMTDPANWRAGDWLECVADKTDLTAGRLYLVKRIMGDPVIDDDEDSDIVRPAGYFRFHSRP